MICKYFAHTDALIKSEVYLKTIPFTNTDWCSLELGLGISGNYLRANLVAIFNLDYCLGTLYTALNVATPI